MPTRRGAHPLTCTLAAVGAASLTFAAARFLVDFLGSSRPYGLSRSPDLPVDSDAFLNFLSTVTNGTIRPTRIARLRDGVEFYPAMLQAIREARHSICLESYEVLSGGVTNDFLQALTERARAGVEVRLIVDAVGSFSTPDALFDPLRRAGGRMYWYHPLRWTTWPQVNNRTHRKLLLVDSRIGFIGGAGIADQWLFSTATEPVWRDTMFRVEGQAVTGLISTFSENWLEASGEILFLNDPSPAQPDPSGAPGFVVLSTPRGGGTQAHILFQALIQSARKSIHITTPYFLPDRSARTALAEACSQRGVDVQILVAGPRIDHPTIRHFSRHSSRHLLECGARIFEYQPAMIHAKLMTVDGQWCVLGSTNFDHRSFALNDEVNLAVLDPALAAIIEADFQDDLRKSCPLKLSALPPPGPLHAVDKIIDQLAEQES